MGLKSFFAKLTGGPEGEAEPGEAVDYQGYQIRPQPKAKGGQFYTAGIITKAFPEGPREQYFIRADSHASREHASEHAIVKGRQIIDEQGDKLFRED